jgi:hypothetical protein
VEAVVVVIFGSLIALALLLWTVHRLKPARFRLKASFTKWVSLDVQMEASPPTHRDSAGQIVRSTDGPDAGPANRARRAYAANRARQPQADEPQATPGPDDRDPI